jgi:hypothetical protein
LVTPAADEDPALLTGPDRFSMYTVSVAHLPAHHEV